MLMSHDCVFSLVKGLTVENFNTFSCHAPLNVEIYVKDDKYCNNDHCTCRKQVFDKFCWNEGFKDDITNDLVMNAQKFDEILLNLTEENSNIDECVDQLNKLLTDICEQYTKTEIEYTDLCDYCINCDNRNTRKSVNYKTDKPWITEDCKILYRQYKEALSKFNVDRSDDNRIKLTVAKRKYKSTESKLKRRYKNQQGIMLKKLRRNKPKKSYRKFRKPKNKTINSIS